MRIIDFLQPERVVADMSATNKAEALRELSECLSPELPGVSADELVAILEERERLGSTGLEDGLAIPHGKLGNIQTVHACFGRSRGGVDFAARDGKPSELFFLLVAPEDSSMLHLKALARISRLLKHEDFRKDIAHAGSAAEIYEAIRRGDERV